MTSNQGYTLPLNNSTTMTTSPFNQQPNYYYNSKPMSSNNYNYRSMPVNAYETSPNISSNSSGYSSADSFLFGGSTYNSPCVNSNSYINFNVNISPYAFSTSMYGNSNDFSSSYQQQQIHTTTTSSPNYFMPLQESTNAPYNGNSNKTGVKRTRAPNKLPLNEETSTASSFDTNYILNEIFKKTNENDEQPQAKKIKRAYNKKSKSSQLDMENASKLQEKTETTFNAQPYLNYNDVIAQQQNSRAQSVDFDENEYDDDEDEENYSVNSFGERKKRVLTRSQRIAANQRERKRMNIMNQSYMKLRQVLPISTGRKRRKMSRLDIVVGAMEYISYLAELVERDEPCEIKFDIFKNCLYDYD